MNDGLSLKWRFLDRAVKPVSLGLMLSMFVMFGEGFDDDGGLIGEFWFSHVAAGFAGLVGVLLFWAWWKQSNRLVQLSLLGATFVWCSRMILFFTVSHPDWERHVLAGAILIIAGGSYLLEVTDPRTSGGGINAARDNSGNSVDSS